MTPGPAPARTPPTSYLLADRLLLLAAALAFLLLAQPVMRALLGVVPLAWARELIVVAGLGALALPRLSSPLWLRLSVPDPALRRPLSLVLIASLLMGLALSSLLLCYLTGTWLSLAVPLVVSGVFRLIPRPRPQDYALPAAVPPPPHPALRALLAETGFVVELRVAQALPAPAMLQAVNGEPAILLSAQARDTLPLDLQRMLVAHELGHHAARHVQWTRRMPFFQIAAGLLGGLLLCLPALGDAGPLAPARTVGLYVLGYALGLTAWLPIALAWLRRMEHQANDYALRLTGDGEALAQLARWTHEQLGAPARPGRLERWLTLQAPSLADVEAQAEAFRRERASVSVGGAAQWQGQREGSSDAR